MVNPDLWLLVNLISTWFMVGLIWVIQLVHYPLFSLVGADQFPEYQRRHANRISPIVGIPMLVELVTAILLCVMAPNPIERWTMIAGLILVGVIWISTAFVQVPCHAILGRGFDLKAQSLLVVSNWIRTIAWTARGLLMAYSSWLVMQATTN